MFGALARRLFGSANDRYVKSLRPIVDAINEIEPQLEAMSDDELRARTQHFKEQLAEGAELEDILIDAFATVREAAKRTLGQRHFDVQLMGGVVLHRGMISEMKTGEGKTLVATMPVYLNALAGKGVHVVTVNDYLARRDADWMGAIYRFLGLTVGVIQHDLTDGERQLAYNADVTYGTNNELENMETLHAINQGLRAHHLFKRDVDYLIDKEGKVVIVDEFTGRMMPGRRWSDGLHQAVEAKEGVTIERENQTLATITFQNYFRMYAKLAGMTGTADTEAYEFQHIYALETVVIPTHKPMIREDRMDQVYQSLREKYEAVIKDINSCCDRGQPVLVGTTSIENS